MKRLILIVLISFLYLGCSCDKTKVEPVRLEKGRKVVTASYASGSFVIVTEEMGPQDKARTLKLSFFSGGKSQMKGFEIEIIESE